MDIQFQEYQSNSPRFFYGQQLTNLVYPLPIKTKSWRALVLG